MDITMCTSGHCPMRKSCLRARGEPNKIRQSYANFEYTCNENDGFSNYIKYEKTKR